MAVWSIVDFAEMQRVGRWDTEFYQPVYLQLQQHLRTATKRTISDVASLSVAPFSPALANSLDYVEIAGVDLTVGTIAPERLGSDNAPDRAQFVMQGGEILVSTVRPNRSCIGIVPIKPGKVPLVASSGFAPLQANNEAHRALLFVWLKTQQATDWLERHTSASMYPAVSVADLLATPMPVVPPSVLHQVHTLFVEMQDALERGRRAYPEAEAELLERLDWNQLNAAPKELYYTASIDTLGKANRCDPEFFQPQYARLAEQIKQRGGMTLGSLVLDFAKGTQPSGYTEDGQVVVLKSKNVYGRGIDWQTCDRTSDADGYDPLAQLQAGDVVINATGRGTLGRAEAITSSVPSKTIAAVDLLICRPDTTRITPAYLALFLNSPAGLAQSDQYQTGSSGQLHLYPQHIAQFQIYIPRNTDGSVDLGWQNALAAKVQQAGDAKTQARHKLEQAKRLVEDALAANTEQKNKLSKP